VWKLRTPQRAQSGSMSEALLKARLICAGKVRVEAKIPPGYICKDAAGPHGSKRTIFFEFGKHRVKMEIAHSDFCLRQENGKFFLFEGEKKVLVVKLLKPVFHAPEMAFFNLLPGCEYNCSFCTLGGREQRDVDLQGYLRLVEAKQNEIKSIALTSGVSADGKDVNLMKEFLAMAKKFELPIGVEPFVTKKEQIDELANGGADEIKINVHSFANDVLARYCPAFLRNTQALLEHAIRLFGEGKVTTNVLLGLGESRENLLEGLEQLASLGVIPCLRYVQGFSSLSPSALLEIAQESKRIMARYGIKNNMETMCLSCKCCDIVPGWDV